MNANLENLKTQATESGSTPSRTEKKVSFSGIDLKKTSRLLN
jgi:hypothetical protein